MKFDTNLNKSPVYVDEKMLKRLGACSMAREEFRDLFGKGAKVPVTRRNWMALTSHPDTTWLHSEWLGDAFLDKEDPAGYAAAFGKWFRDNTNKTRGHFQWHYVRRVLKAKYPEFYAKAAK